MLKCWRRNTQMWPGICGHSPGSARVARAGFGVAPKQSFEKVTASPMDSTDSEEVRDREDAFARSPRRPLPGIAFERRATDALTSPPWQNENARTNLDCSVT